MRSFILRRVLYIIPVILLVALVASALLALIPGDPATKVAGEFATPQQVELIRKQLHLDQPFLERYVEFVWHLLQGNLGTSTTYQPGVSVAHLIAQAGPVTLSATIVTMAITVLLGFPMGVLSAFYRGRAIDRVTTLFVTAGLAIPPFVIGPVLVTLLALDHSIFPAVGYVSFGQDPAQWLWHLILPCFALALNSAAELCRQVRAAFVNELDQSYVRTAYGKGLTTRRVIGKHAMKNAGITTITVLGLQVNRIVGGVVIIEYIFNLPGLGALAYASVLKPDYPVIQALVVITALFVLVCNLLVDISYLYFDPKLRERAKVLA